MYLILLKRISYKEKRGEVHSRDLQVTVTERIHRDLQVTATKYSEAFLRHWCYRTVLST